MAADHDNAGERFDGGAPDCSIYRLRWRIEQTFRACKSDGLGLPDLQTHSADRLFKIAALGLGAAVRTIQPVRRWDLVIGRAAMLPTRKSSKRRRPLARPGRARRRGDAILTRPLFALAVLDYRPPGRLELLFQAAWAKDHAGAGWDKLAAGHGRGFHLAISIRH